jgi:hypothetical protein
MKFWWVSIAPFGGPVVPPVYNKAAIASDETLIEGVEVDWDFSKSWRR